MWIPGINQLVVQISMIIFYLKYIINITITGLSWHKLSIALWREKNNITRLL